MRKWESYIGRQKQEYLETRYPEDFYADMIVVIPCYDEPEIEITLSNLKGCLSDYRILVAVIINSGVRSDEDVVLQNRKTFDEIKEFAKLNNSDQIHFFPIIFEQMPRKHAGVGLARKIGMDLSTAHFMHHNNPHGIIISLDADCKISPNFLEGIEKAYQSDEKLICTIQNFHHRAENNDPLLENAIRQYETHIRYFSRALQYTGFPYHLHTIGSAFSVTADAYVKSGGMGRQQGGEDFYFLQKIFAMGKSTFLKDVFVYPMARYSDRIPFGTGPALQKIIDEPDGKMKSYNFEAFIALKKLFDHVKQFYKKNNDYIEEKLKQLHPALSRFCFETGVPEEIKDCNKNSATLSTFEKRFFHHFNAFKIIKFLNQSHQTDFRLSAVEDELAKAILFF